MKTHNLKRYKETRQALRTNETAAEMILWMQLKNRPKGNKFRRQHGIGRYIVDFYCPNQRLIIELDGEVHSLPETHEYDQQRETELRGAGFHLLRFSNQQIFQEMDSVLSRITEACV